MTFPIYLLKNDTILIKVLLSDDEVPNENGGNSRISTNIYKQVKSAMSRSLAQNDELRDIGGITLIGSVDNLRKNKMNKSFKIGIYHGVYHHPDRDDL